MTRRYSVTRCIIFTCVTTMVTTIGGEYLTYTKPNTAYCLETHKMRNGKCYKVYWLARTLDEAETLCNKLLEGHLASYHSQREYNFLKNQQDEEAWIGAWANSTTNTIEFTDGSTLDYTPSPLNAGNVSQSCIAIHRNYSTGRNCNERKRFICASTPFQLNENYPNYCPQEHIAFQGKCYKLYREQSKNKKAEESCNKLPEGHLATYHTKEEYDFVVSLTVPKPDVWIGARKVAPVQYKFTDGSAYDYLVPGDDLEGDCLVIVNSTHPDGRVCEAYNYQFICMSKALNNKVIVTETAARGMANLLDGDDTTCVDSQALYGTRGHYSGIITWEKNATSDRTIKFEVRFNTTSNCRKRKVLSTNPGKDLNEDCSTLRRCKLLTESSVLTSICRFECACPEVQCYIVYGDTGVWYRMEPADACEIRDK